VSRSRGAWGGLARGAWGGLAIGLVAFAFLFRAEIAAAVNTWTTSTAYNHCFLVIPIALFLMWDRRASLRGLTAAPAPLMALLALPAGFAWLTAERLGIMEGRQLAAVSMLEILSLGVLGRRLWVAVSGPLLYLYLLVPFGEFLTPWLQDVTTGFVGRGLDLIGIPAYIDGYLIEIPEGTFFVAEACAGLRFLIASIAFGVLYALLMYRDPMRRVIFVGVAIIVPIIANGFRALGIVSLGHWLGSAEAAAVDHVLYGWIFFSIVMLVLVALGLPFRQDDRPRPAAASPMTTGPRAARLGLLAGIATAVLAAFGPGIVLGLDLSAAVPEMALRPLDLSPSCVAAGSAGATGRTFLQRVTCGGMPMTIEIEVFPPRSTAAAVNAERRHLTHGPDRNDVSDMPLRTSAGEKLEGWRLIRATQPAYLAAAAMWIDGKPMTPGLAMRVRMAWDSVSGGPVSPAVVVITPVADWPLVDARRSGELEQQISELLEAHPEIGGEVRAMVAAVR
jgi:exosortase A